jgi:hypothetical protein
LWGRGSGEESIPQGKPEGYQIVDGGGPSFKAWLTWKRNVGRDAVKQMLAKMLGDSYEAGE